MTSAYVLILAMLILGGLLAALGDRLGSRVGKARLKLFNLRPKQTAVLVTIVTGTLISASTLGILFATSKSLRQGVFRLDEILEKRQEAIQALERANAKKSEVEAQKREVDRDLRRVTQDKNQVQSQLSEAEEEQALVAQRLEETNTDFQAAKQQLQSVSQQADSLRSEIEMLSAERLQLRAQRDKLSNQIVSLREQVQLRDRELTKRDQTIAQREQEIIAQEQRLREQTEIIAQKSESIAQQGEKIAQQDRAVEQGRQQLASLERTLETEIARRDRAIAQMDTFIAERDNVISSLDTRIAERDRALQERADRLGELEGQLSFLKQEVNVLEQNYQSLRQGDFALVRGQVLASAAVRVNESVAVQDIVNELLRQANVNAIGATQSQNNNSEKERLVRISQSQVDAIVEELGGGGDYVIRILTAGNYLRDEKEVRVFADVAPNQKIFDMGDTIATVSVEPGEMSPEEMQQRLDLLLAASQFRARQAGIIGNIQVGNGNVVTLIRFIEQLNASNIPLDQIRAVASEQAESTGGLRIRLVALQNGRIVFATS